MLLIQMGSGGQRGTIRMAKNAFYAQSGGVTAVINASACGVIETARKSAPSMRAAMASSVRWQKT